MDISQIENLYRVNEIADFKLRTTDDLLKCHGINVKAVEGYKRLDDFNKAIYKRFILNLYNACGLESRATKIPTGIYLVEDTQFLFKRFPEDDYFVVSGGVIKAIDKNGMKIVLHTWKDEENPSHGKVTEETSTYLRFEYTQSGKSTWLHVIKNGSEWY